jgi:PAS domain S-box-containing protein
MLESGTDSSKSEHAEGNLRLEVVLEAIFDPAMVFTADGRLLDANPAAVGAIEAGGVEEMRGGALEDFVADEDKSLAAEANKLLASGGRGEFEWRVAGKKGGRRRFKFRLAPLAVPGGKEAAAIIIGREIIQRPELLGAIVASSGDAIISTDLEGKIAAWNTAAQQLFGFTAEEAIGKMAPALLCSPPFERQAIEILQKVARGEGPLHYETQRLRKDGSLVDVSVTAFGVRNQADQLIGASAIYRDISEKKRLRGAESELTSLIKSASDAIITFTPEGVVTSWNAGAEELYGYPAREAIGKSYSVIVPDEYLEETKAIFRRAVAGEAIQQFESRRVRKDGTLLDVSITLSPIYTEGVVSGISTIIATSANAGGPSANKRYWPRSLKAPTPR